MPVTEDEALSVARTMGTMWVNQSSNRELGVRVQDLGELLRSSRCCSEEEGQSSFEPPCQSCCETPKAMSVGGAGPNSNVEVLTWPVLSTPSWVWGGIGQAWLERCFHLLLVLEVHIDGLGVPGFLRPDEESAVVEYLILILLVHSILSSGRS